MTGFAQVIEKKIVRIQTRAGGQLCTAVIPPTWTPDGRSPSTCPNDRRPAGNDRRRAK